jgi:hypothetical protein
MQKQAPFAAVHALLRCDADGANPRKTGLSSFCFPLRLRRSHVHNFGQALQLPVFSALFADVMLICTKIEHLHRCRARSADHIDG